MKNILLYIAIFTVLRGYSVSAAGLPANPWLANNANHGQAVSQASSASQNNNIDESALYNTDSAPNITVVYEETESQPAPSRVETDNSPEVKQENSQQADDFKKMLQTILDRQEELAKNQENNQNSSASNTAQDNYFQKQNDEISASLDNLNNEAQKINRQYNNYKRKAVSNYNSLKRKAKSMYNTTVNNVKSMERTAEKNTKQLQNIMK